MGSGEVLFDESVAERDVCITIFQRILFLKEGGNVGAVELHRKATTCLLLTNVFKLLYVNITKLLDYTQNSILSS